jgi:hypothetical protein
MVMRGGGGGGGGRGGECLLRPGKHFCACLIFCAWLQI